MSEFADSLHFVGKSVSVVERLMRNAKVRGAILRSNGQTVSVLVGWDSKPHLCSEGSVIDYAYGEDHGVWIRFYKDGQMVAKAVIIWDSLDVGEQDEDNAPGITEGLEAILFEKGFLSAEDSREFVACLRSFDPADESAPNVFVDRVGDVLGLSAFRWINSQDLNEKRVDELREWYPEAILVH